MELFLRAVYLLYVAIIAGWLVNIFFSRFILYLIDH
jgi:hypothetical protein